MEYCNFAHLMGLFLIFGTLQPPATSAESGSVVARDTDKVSDLREKITRLKELLSHMEDKEEKDLKNVAGQKLTKTPFASEDMGEVHEHHLVLTTAATTEQPKPAETGHNLDQLVSRSSSIEILAKALARLKQPNYRQGLSTGDYTRGDNNQPDLDEEEIHEEELLISRALTQLTQGKTSETSNQASSTNRSALRQKLLTQGHDLRVEVIRALEARLMQNLALAKKLGISLNDLIGYLDSKEYTDTQP